MTGGSRVLFLLLLSESVSGLKILHFAAGLSSSHLIFDYRLANASASHGHNVTLWTYLATTGKLSKSVTLDPKIREIVVDLRDTEAVVGFQQFMDLSWNNWDLNIMMEFIYAFTRLFKDSCRYQFDNGSHIIDTLRQEEFDLAIMHGMDACPMIIAYFAGIPLEKMILNYPLQHLAEPLAHSIGVSTNPSYITSVIWKLTDRMSFKDRFISTLIAFNFWFPSNWWGWPEQFEMFQEPPYADNPSLMHMIQQVPYVLISGERSLDFPRPFPHGISHMGQLTQQPKPLPPKYVELLNKNNKGVILVSFGSVADASTVPQNMKLSVINALAKFPDYTIIWKFDADLPEIANYSHIHRVSWMPQRDLLLSAHISVFVTHSGFNSLLETAKAGVPMVLCPLFADQDSNALRAARHGIGVLVNVKDETTFSADLLESKIRTVLEDKSYEKRATKFAAILNDKLISSEEEYIHKIKVVSKFHGRLPTLKNAKKLNYLKYFCLDVLFGIFCFPLLALSILFM